VNRQTEKKLKALGQSKLLKQVKTALGIDAQLHLVGGTVRDLLLGQEGADIDLATALSPQTALDRLEKSGVKVVQTGIQHGTITAVIAGSNIEITAFRKPGDRSTAVHSDTIEEDLSGRDFTINAIAYCLDTNQLIDPFRGEKDLKTGFVRAVSSAEERILEDPLRILRMVRFGPAAGRKVDPELTASSTKHAELLQTISPERIKVELEKILLSSAPGEAFRAMLESGILEQIIPELLPGVRFEQNEFHNEDVFNHTLTVLEQSPPIKAVRLAALFHDTGKPHTLSTDTDGRRHFYRHEAESRRISQSVMKRLKFSNDDIKEVSTLVEYHMRPLDCGPAGVRRLMRDLGPYFDDWLRLKVADACPGMSSEIFENQLRNFEQMLEDERQRQKGSVYGKLAINGHDLIELGLKEGEILGKVLKEVESMVIEDPELNEREVLLQKAIDIIKKNQYLH
jgi:tRNA nucleotidyltransferase (CCA-adding enzyme)